MIKNVINLSGGGVGSEEVDRIRFTRVMQPVIQCTKDSGALDNSQCFLLDIYETDTEWRAFYAGANTQTTNYTPDGQDYTNNDATFLAVKTKSNDVKSGWTKVLDVNSDPKPVLKPSFVGGQFDYWQVWIRTVIEDGGVLKAWFVGDDGTPTFDYRVGYATSDDEGETWTKSGTTPIYTDLLSSEGSRGIVVLKVIKDSTNFKMVYCGVAPQTYGFKIAQSTDGITSWSVIQSGLFAGQEFGFPSDFKKVGSTYYLWLQRKNMMPEGNLGPCREVVLFSSTDLATWTNRGIQMVIKNNAQEFGIGNHTKVLQKPNGEWFMAHTFYINRTQALAGITKEPSTGIKVSESNSTTFIMNSSCDFSYPDYVTFHAPLDNESGFIDEIGGQSGTISAAASYAERGFIRLSGQTITLPNNGSVINGADFQLHMRVETLTTGTHTLLKIGNDIWWTLESGKIRIRVSSDGVSYQKDYISTVNIGKPTGLDYIDNHVYIAVSCVGGVIRIWNEDCVTELSAGQITKTVDNALTSANNSGASIVIGSASLEVRSLSILDGATATELTELCI